MVNMFTAWSDVPSIGNSIVPTSDLSSALLLYTSCVAIVATDVYL